MSASITPLPRPPLSTPQLTLRAMLTGMILGGGLSLCNIYTGLKVGWGLSMSITAALLGFSFWQMLRLTGRVTPLNIYETNINQTAASSAAAISSAGLVAPIPALTMITGQTLSWGALVIWTFSVCLVGITVAVGLRRQLIEVDKLTFPNGVATGETLREIYAHGKEAVARVWALGLGAAAACAIKLTDHLTKFARWSVPVGWATAPDGALAKAGHSKLTLGNLGFAIETTSLMYGVGALIGPRVGCSLLFGTAVAWGVLAPIAFDAGWARAGVADPNRVWYTQGLEWLLWPGVAMMVTAALTSFSFSWRSILNAFKRRAPVPATEAAADEPPPEEPILPRQWLILALIFVLALSVTLQVLLFSISAWIAVLGVLLTFVLALVAARVSGETNVTPVGAMGKVTQLLFAVLAPGQPAANLMSANVTGGAASQCADLMHDLKTGYMIGARPRYQFFAQVGGALAGALAGSAGYLILVPDPVNQLLTEQWPAPAVATWKAVAEIFMKGVDALPPGAVNGMVLGGLAGIVLAVAEKVLPKRARLGIPSPTSVGLAFVIPAYNSISMFLGAMMAWALGKWFPKWSTRFLVVVASGLIAGESLTGVGLAIEQMIVAGGK